MSSKLLSIKVFLTVCLLCLIGGGKNCAWAQDADVVTVTDVLTADMFPATSTTYTNFSNVETSTSNAIYAGNSAKNSAGAIQLRSKNSNSGIVTTASGGKILKIAFEFERGSNTIDIYGNSKPYSSAADLYDTSGNTNQGTKIGSINKDGEISFDADKQYPYIGIRSNNGAIYITSITITYAKTTPITLTTAQYGTYFTNEAFVMPEGVTGYTITDKDGENLTLNEAYTAGTTVPASTALVLKATDELTESKTFNAVVVNSTETAPTDNLLHGTVEAATTSVEGATAYYKLANGDKGLGFYYGAENGAAFTNGAHKAYLAVKGNLSQMKGFSFDGMTTGINQVSTAKTNDNANIYDLNGRRIQSLGAAQKGIYIVGGKKVIVK